MRWLFVVMQVALLIRLLRLGMHRDFPVFVAYLCLSIPTNCQLRVGDARWWHTVWLSLSAVLLLGRALVVAEVFWMASLELLRQEFRWMLVCLTAASLMSSCVIFGSSQGWNWFHRLLSIRECLQLGMCIWLAAGLLYLWQRDIVLERNTRVHAIIFTCLLGVKAISSMLDPRTGVMRHLPLPAPVLLLVHWPDRISGVGTAIWMALSELHYLGMALCCAAWLCLLSRPKTHWWTLLGPRFDGLSAARLSPPKQYEYSSR